MTIHALTWGVKASFRGYVEAAGGSIKLEDGATQTVDGAFVFTALPGGDLSIASDGTASGSMKFQGSVTFDAHGGMLHSTLSDLALEVIDGKLVITVAEAPANDSRCAVAELTFLESNDKGEQIFRSAITMDGMYQIADNYPPGTELDPITLS